MSFRTYYDLKKTISSLKLSLLTPYIKLYPKNSTSELRIVISRAVKSILIKQDSDVIVFNKIVALVEFAPDDKLITTRGRVRNSNKYNFMYHTLKIFNQGSVWHLRTGWTGPKSVRNIINVENSQYSVLCTLFKTNLNLVNNRYTGTILFCRCSFLGFRDSTIPLDCVISSFNNNPKITLSDKDWLLDNAIINSFDSLTSYMDSVNDSLKQKLTDHDNIKKMIDSAKLRSSQTALRNSAMNFLRGEALNTEDILTREDLKSISESNQLFQSKYTSVKWATARYVLRTFYSLLFSKDYLIDINALKFNKDIFFTKIDVDGGNKYFAPYRVLKISKYLKEKDNKLILNQILDKFVAISGGPHILYFKDMTLVPLSFRSIVDGIYKFDDAGDTLVDLYALNKKIYLTNILLRLASINLYRMTGYPSIRIKFLNVSQFKNKKQTGRRYSLGVSIMWNYPQSVRIDMQDSLPTLNLYYDRANLLFNNLKLLLPRNNQMLKINLSRYLSSASATTPEQQKQLMFKGIVQTIKKVMLPQNSNSGIDTLHTNLKHRMYLKLVIRTNKRSTSPNSADLTQPSDRQIKRGLKFAGKALLGSMGGNNNLILYYFSSFLTNTKVTEFNKLVLSDKNDYLSKDQIVNAITCGSRGDISASLISYLRSRMNISVDIHGVFDVPVFRSFIRLFYFPGPTTALGKRWLNGKYLITSQSTRVDRTNIKTTLYRKRIPEFRLTKVTNDKNDQRPQYIPEDTPLEGNQPTENNWRTVN